MRIKLLLGAVAALGLLVSPASASPPVTSRDTPVGDCTLQAVNVDPANPGSTHYEGLVDCWVVFHAKNFGLSTTAHATVTAWVQTDANHDGGGILEGCVFASSVDDDDDPRGSVVTGACGMSFTVAASQPLYLCVKYTWREAVPSRHFSYTLDSDPVTPDRQCEMAVRVRNLSVTARAASPSPPV